MTNATLLKSAIIGRVWVNSDNKGIIPSSFTLPEDMTFSANETYLIGQLTFKTDRNLNASAVEGETAPLSFKAGEQLFLYSNEKRAGHKDPDYSVSVRLPSEVAEAIITNSQRASDAWRASNSLPM